MALLKYKQIGEIDPDFYKKLAMAESGGKSIKNPQKGASAAGIYQFTEGTWKNVVNKLGLNYTLNDRYDPQKQQVVIEQFTKDNEKSLFNTLGRKPNNTELYTAHFLGAGGANQFLRQLMSNPDAKSTPSEAVLKYNKGVFLDKSGRLRTNREVYNELSRRIGGSGNNMPSSPVDMSYLNEVTPKLINFGESNSSGIFATDEQEPVKIDKKQVEAEKMLADKTNDLNFIDEIAAQNEQMIKQSFSQAPTQQQKQIQINPLDQTYVSVSQFVDNPIMAQQGGVYYDYSMNTPILNPDEFTIDYLQSPKYRERLVKAGYKNPDEVIKRRLANVTDVRYVEQNGKPSVLEGIWNKINQIPYSNQGSAYITEGNTIVMDTADKNRKELKGLGFDAINAHELGHTELSGYGLNRRDEDQLFNRQKYYDGTTIKEREEIKQKGRKSQFSNVPHNYRPEENKSDLNGLRYLLQKENIYDAGKEDFTKEHLNKLKNNFFKERLLRNYTEEDLIWLMNNVADASTPNANIYGQQGGTVKKAYNPNLENSRDFQEWYRKNTVEGRNNIPYSNQLDYDYLSFYMNKEYQNYTGGHFPDTYKRPIHETFSNESIYSTPENPGGYWKGETYYKNGKFTYQSGGVIKDNNGYWNPNNWGKTVEIASPNITMKGVNQPLLGISKETGEKKIMFPNLEYFFKDTKSVIEMPLK